MYWDGYWECGSCGCEIHTSEDDNDGIIEGLAVQTRNRLSAEIKSSCEAFL